MYGEGETKTTLEDGIYTCIERWSFYFMKNGPTKWLGKDKLPVIKLTKTRLR